MYISAIASVKARVIIRVLRSTAFISDFGIMVFNANFLCVNRSTLYFVVFRAQRDIVAAKGNVILINGRYFTFSIKINKRCDSICFTVFLIKYSIMSKISNELCDLRFGKLLFHGKPIL